MDQFSIPGNTDTAAPQATVPLFLIHSVARPFCPDPLCWCQAQRTQLLLFLEALKSGEMTLCQAASFTDGGEGKRESQ